MPGLCVIQFLYKRKHIMHTIRAQTHNNVGRYFFRQLLTSPRSSLSGQLPMEKAWDVSCFPTTTIVDVLGVPFLDFPSLE